VYKWVVEENGVKCVKCPLCKQQETARHIMFECSETKIARDKHKVVAGEKSLSEVYLISDKAQLESVGKYLNVVRALRGDALSKLRSVGGVEETAAKCNCGVK